MSRVSTTSLSTIALSGLKNGAMTCQLAECGKGMLDMQLKRVSFQNGAFLALFLSLVVACEQPSTAPEGAPMSDSSVAAIVNGETIYSSDVELVAVAEGRVEPYSDFDPAHPAFSEVLDGLIDQRLLAQEAVRRGLDQDPAAIRRLAAARERLLVNFLIESLFEDEVFSASFDRWYEEQVKLQQLDDEVSIRRIIAMDAQQAEQIHAELIAGKDFAEAALEYSTDVQTKLNGGTIGWVRPNDLVDPYPAIIGNTPTGTFSEIFESQDGWTIVKVDERRTPPPKTKDEMRPFIINYLTLTQLADIAVETRSGAEIQRRDADQAPAVEDAASQSAAAPAESDAP